MHTCFIVYLTFFLILKESHLFDIVQMCSSVLEVYYIWDIYYKLKQTNHCVVFFYFMLLVVQCKLYSLYIIIFK